MKNSIKSERKALGLTQQELAEECGWPVKSGSIRIGYAESGRNQGMRGDTIKIIRHTLASLRSKKEMESAGALQDTWLTYLMKLRARWALAPEGERGSIQAGLQLLFPVEFDAFVRDILENGSAKESGMSTEEMVRVGKIISGDIDRQKVHLDNATEKLAEHVEAEEQAHDEQQERLKKKAG